MAPDDARGRTRRVPARPGTPAVPGGRRARACARDPRGDAAPGAEVTRRADRCGGRAPILVRRRWRDEHGGIRLALAVLLAQGTTEQRKITSKHSGFTYNTTKRLTLLTTTLQELCQPFCSSLRRAARRAAADRFCLQIHTILYNFLLTLACMYQIQACIQPSESLHHTMSGSTSVDAHTSLL